jgi:hypothetical protein
VRLFALAAVGLAAFAMAGGAAAQERTPNGATDDATAEKREAPSPDAEDAKAKAARLDEAPVVMRYPPSRARIGIILAGAGLTATAYAFGAAAAAGWPDVPGSKYLYAPVVGPWIALAKGGCTPTDEECTGKSAILYVRGALYILSGLVQAGGLAVVAEGIFTTTEKDAPEKKKAVNVQVLPIATPTMSGLGVFGTF